MLVVEDWWFVVGDASVLCIILVFLFHTIVAVIKKGVYAIATFSWSSRYPPYTHSVSLVCSFIIVVFLPRILNAMLLSSLPSPCYVRNCAARSYLAAAGVDTLAIRTRKRLPDASSFPVSQYTDGSLSQMRIT